MSDRIDDKISSFVVELLDDPPPAPDVDLDAGRPAAPLGLTVPRFRLKGLAVAAAAFVVVIAVIGVVALVPWPGGIETQQPTTVPTTTVPPANTTPAPQTTVPSSYGLTEDELLRVEDLPADLDWQVFDQDEGADSIAGWGIFEHGILVVRCDEGLGLTAWRLDPSPRSADQDKPWVRLDDALFRAMYAETAVFGEALYSSAPVTVTEAFNMMKAVTVACLPSRTSAADQADLLAMRQVGGDSIVPDYEVSAADEAQLLTIPPLGDDSVAIRMKWYLNRFETRYDLFRLAVIRQGTRLLIVEEHETVLSPDDPPRVSDSEFIAIVQTAVARLES